MNLKEFKFELSYSVGETPVVTSECDASGNEVFSYSVKKSADNALKLVLKANKTINLVSSAVKYDYTFPDGSKFFVNGYQSWSVSREFAKDDVQKGLLGPSKIKFAQFLSAVSGDYYMAKYSKDKGVFHSHTYTYVKNGLDMLLIGSLSERKGFTVIYADMNKSVISVEKDLLGVTLEEGAEYELYNIVSFEGGYDEVFDEYFKAMGVKPSKLADMIGYTSWYNYFQKINEEIILRDLDGILRVKENINLFQIDDGYATKVGEWKTVDPVKFPNGLKPIVEKVHENNLTAGLWLAPFSVQRSSKLVKEHPDWFIKNAKGKNLIGGLAWHGFYVIDFYKEEVRDYIKGCFDNVFDNWGFDMVKLDFLYSTCIYPRNGKSRGEIMCDAIDFLRECCRDKIVLGCGVPLGPVFGKFDACRVGCDAEFSFKDRFYVSMTNQEIISTRHSINNSIFRRHLNDRVFKSDPDVFFLRDENAKYTEKQKELLGLINNFCGGVLYVSDNVNNYGDDRLKQLKDLFTKKNIKIHDANYISDTVIQIAYEEDETVKVMVLGLLTGEFRIR